MKRNLQNFWDYCSLPFKKKSLCHRGLQTAGKNNKIRPFYRSSWWVQHQRGFLRSCYLCLESTRSWIIAEVFLIISCYLLFQISTATLCLFCTWPENLLYYYINIFYTSYVSPIQILGVLSLHIALLPYLLSENIILLTAIFLLLPDNLHCLLFNHLSACTLYFFSPLCRNCLGHCQLLALPPECL